MGGGVEFFVYEAQSCSKTVITVLVKHTVTCGMLHAAMFSKPPSARHCAKGSPYLIESVLGLEQD